MGLPKPVTVGAVYNRLTIIKEVSPHVQPNGRERRKVEVSCTCGKVFQTHLESVYAGTSKSCGCLNIEHGMSKSKFQCFHNNMKARCDNPLHPSYPDYGGRGIRYAPKWKKFQSFMDDMYDSYEEGLSLDRIDVDGDYTKENCRWTNDTVQGHNKRKKPNCLFKYKGIHLNTNKTRYVAAIRERYLSTFDCLEDAAKAYDDASMILYEDRPNGTLFIDDDIYKLISAKLEYLGQYKSMKQ